MFSFLISSEIIYFTSACIKNNKQEKTSKALRETEKRKLFVDLKIQLE
jgi:hypothetical protein